MTSLLAETVKRLLEWLDYQPDYSKCQGKLVQVSALALVLIFGRWSFTSF